MSWDLKAARKHGARAGALVCWRERRGTEIERIALGRAGAAALAAESLGDALILRSGR